MLYVINIFNTCHFCFKKGRFVLTSWKMARSLVDWYWLCGIVDTNVMDERRFAWFEFKMSFGRISFIAQHPRTVSIKKPRGMFRVSHASFRHLVSWNNCYLRVENLIWRMCRSWSSCCGVLLRSRQNGHHFQTCLNQFSCVTIVVLWLTFFWDLFTSTQFTINQYMMAWRPEDVRPLSVINGGLGLWGGMRHATS